MKITVNKKSQNIMKGSRIADILPKGSIAVIDGYGVGEDYELRAGDNVLAIQRGEMPSEEMLSDMLTARNGVYVTARISKACVAVCGLGGLGSNIAISLARIGVGKLILIDSDIVDPTNLNRQNYYLEDIGKYKADALKAQIGRINPNVIIDSKVMRLDSHNLMSAVAGSQVVVEAFDLPECKAMLANTVLCEGSQYVVAASGMAGYGSSNDIVTERDCNRLYVVGDRVSEASIGNGLMSPRVLITAGHQANMVLRILLGIKEA